MQTDNIIFGSLFGGGGLVSSFFLFTPRFRKFARWAGSGAPMSLLSRICFCLFLLSCSVIAFTTSLGSAVAVPLTIFLVMFISMAADRQRHLKGGHDV